MAQVNARNSYTVGTTHYPAQDDVQLKVTFRDILAVICELLSGDVSDLEQLNSHN